MHHRYELERRMMYERPPPRPRDPYFDSYYERPPSYMYERPRYGEYERDRYISRERERYPPSDAYYDRRRESYYDGAAPYRY